MFHSLQSICYGIVLLFILLSMPACDRPLFVSHWSGEGRALIKKKSYGWPNHGFLASIVCMNKLCLNRAERMNKWAKKRFKGFKNKKQVLPSPGKGKPRSRPKFEE
jgi:hypothetical protein